MIDTLKKKIRIFRQTLRISGSSLEMNVKNDFLTYLENCRERIRADELQIVTNQQILKIVRLLLKNQSDFDSFTPNPQGTEIEKRSKI